MNEQSDVSKKHLQEIALWYKDHGLHIGPLINEKKQAYEWLMWCRRTVRTSLKNADIYAERFRKAGLPKSILTDDLGIQQSHIDSVTMRCDQLQEFYEEHHHYRVPLRYPNGLGKWMQRNRELFATDPTHCRVQAILDRFPKSSLKKITTKFNDKGKSDKVWNGFLKQLEAYKDEHGHTNVPRRAKDPNALKKLGVWVYKQRVAFRNDKLRYDRIHALMELGFCFNPKSGPK